MREKKITNYANKDTIIFCVSSSGLKVIDALSWSTKLINILVRLAFCIEA